MRENIRNLVRAIIDKKPTTVKQALNTTLFSKANVALDQRKAQVAKNLFKK